MHIELPEERLLNLIKSKGKAAAESRPAAAAAGRQLDLSFIKRLVNLKTLKPKDIIYINRSLAAAAAVSLVYLIAVVFFPYKNYHNVTAPSISVKSSERPAEAALKEYSVYSQAIQSKKLFFPESVTNVADVGQSSGLSEQFNLVGIIAGDSPQAVIEDKKANKTYYLYKGASFNGTVVEDIGSGKVILDCKGERVSLVL